MDSLGKKIERLRKENKITQEELAASLDVSRQSVSQWEQDISTPKSDKLRALCEFFNVKPDYFLFEEEEAKPLIKKDEVDKDWLAKLLFIRLSICAAVGLVLLSICIWLGVDDFSSEINVVIIICVAVLCVVVGIAIAFIVDYVKIIKKGK